VIQTPGRIDERSGLTTRITVYLPKFAHDLEMDRIAISVPNLQVNFDEIRLKPRLLSVSSKSGFLVAAVSFVVEPDLPSELIPNHPTGYQG